MDTKTYTYRDAPLKVCGVPYPGFEENGILSRYPDELIAKMESEYMPFLGKRCPGARLLFRTNAPSFKLSITFRTLSVDVGMSLFACQAAAVFVGERKNAVFAGILNPKDYEQKTFEGTFYKSSETEDVTVILPRNEIIDNIELEVPASALVEAPTPYTYAKPVVFYGSSITEGGCSAFIGNTYINILSRHLDFDYYNLGFSGSARGELASAEFITKLPMSVFVYDYDHNAPSPEHLAKTHEPFFRTIRERCPNLPVLMLSRPYIHEDDDILRRKEIIRKTYENAAASGDKNVWFIDGGTFFGDVDRDLCTVDKCHPNDLGFYRMASVVEPYLREALERAGEK